MSLRLNNNFDHTITFLPSTTCFNQEAELKRKVVKTVSFIGSYFRISFGIKSKSGSFFEFRLILIFSSTFLGMIRD